MEIGPVDSPQVLCDELLCIYEHMLLRHQCAAAEHVLRALEELARCSPACRARLVEAYLLSVRSATGAPG